MPQQIISQLKELKNVKGRVNPDHFWVEKNREILLQQISQTVPDKKSFIWSDVWDGMAIFLPNRLVYGVIRPVTALLLIGAVATSGWIASVSATESCLPGQVCYGVKMAVEKTQELVVTATSSGEETTQMHLDFAQKRANEAKKVVENKKPDASKQAKVAIDKMEKSIKTASETLKDVSNSKPEKVLAVAQNVTTKTKEISETLKEISDTLKNTENQTTEVNVADAKSVLKEAGFQAMETIVQTKEEGKVVVDEQALKDLIKNEINNVLTDSQDLQTNVEALAKSIENKGELMIELPTMTAPVNTTTVAEAETQTSSSTVTTTVQTISLTALTTDITKKVEGVQAIIKTDLEAVAVLMENNQVKEALQKVKETSQLAQETNKIVSEVQKLINQKLKINIIPEENINQPASSTTTSVPVEPVFNTTTSPTNTVVTKIEEIK